jgi:aryl sulfotransferase
VDVLPQHTRTYQHHHLDSTRWERFIPRDNDIIISTPYKSGTTWMQEIVVQLIFLDRDVPSSQDVSPWLDARFQPIDALLSQLEHQEHRRCIKSHLALDGLPYFPSSRYVVVGRDPRDVFMSLWNHYTSHTPQFFEMLNGLPGRVGAPFPPPPDDIHELWRAWISQGWFEWEQEGFPYWGNMHHLQTWFDYRHLDNILLVHFADLLEDPFFEVRRTADFLGIAASDEQIEAVVRQTTLATMRTRGERKDLERESAWVDGARSFFYKGTNGRWKDVLSAEEMVQYEQAAGRVLTPDCRTWLERGHSARLD